MASRGAKDLLDTAGIPTTYGAEPFKNRKPDQDATVVQRLHEAGAVLVAKLSLGALALNDIWFGGQTMNPWLLEEGSSGSSAGPGAATAAGLVAFAVGSETGGSIVAPSMRCGVTGLRVGYFPAWMKQATDVDRAALDTVRKVGATAVEVSIPDWPYDSLNVILFAEAAAAFEELTLSGAVNQLKMQVPDAWPNIFRQSRFLSAVDFVQCDRLRRKVAIEMARVFSQVDLLLVPSLRDEIPVITNATGHPSLTLRAGFVEVSEARSDWAPDPAHPLPKFNPSRRVSHGVTLIGRLFDEGTIGRVGLALERAFGVAAERPTGFDA
jgi:Asp-tRNA(Asn)/Glu-tRNA(Gln) amidotransferase A subunit family amidase